MNPKRIDRITRFTEQAIACVLAASLATLIVVALANFFREYLPWIAKL